MSSAVYATADADGRRRLRLTGTFRLEESSELRRDVLESLSSGEIAYVDLSEVERLEGSAASALADALCTSGELPEIVGAKPSVRSIMDLYTAAGQCPARLPQPPRVPFLDQVGASTLDLLAGARTLLSFIAEASGAAIQVVRRPRSVEWGSVLRQIERHGADGLPIVLVIGSLMGLITAFQAAVQLQQFGADSFVADLVSISLTRELAPLMAAIVVAGRSGAAIAAEMGTMKVSEEIDALHTLGICPHRFLVFPRILALVLVMPLLTLLADFVGIASGAVAATSIVEVGLRQFAVSTQAALQVADVLGGVLKSMVFGLLIAGIACERGLAARGGAEGVGRVTTSAVVSTLFWLVLADALFALLFEIWGIY